MPVISIGFCNPNIDTDPTSPTVSHQKLSKEKVLKESNSTKLNAKRDLMILHKVYSMNKRYSLKPLWYFTSSIFYIKFTWITWRILIELLLAHEIKKRKKNIFEKWEWEINLIIKYK